MGRRRLTIFRAKTGKILCGLIRYEGRGFLGPAGLHTYFFCRKAVPVTGKAVPLACEAVHVAGEAICFYRQWSCFDNGEAVSVTDRSSEIYRLGHFLSRLCLLIAQIKICGIPLAIFWSMAGAKRRRSSSLCSTVIELKPGITVTITMTRLSELDLKITSKR